MAINNLAALAAIIKARKEAGRRGGLSTAQKYGSEFCRARAENAGHAVKTKYGTGYYRHIRKQVKGKVGWPKGKPRRPILGQSVSLPQDQFSPSALSSQTATRKSV